MSQDVPQIRDPGLSVRVFVCLLACGVEAKCQHSDTFRSVYVSGGKGKVPAALWGDAAGGCRSAAISPAVQQGAGPDEHQRTTLIPLVRTGDQTNPQPESSLKESRPSLRSPIRRRRKCRRCFDTSPRPEFFLSAPPRPESESREGLLSSLCQSQHGPNENGRRRPSLRLFSCAMFCGSLTPPVVWLPPSRPSLPCSWR